MAIGQAHRLVLRHWLKAIRFVDRDGHAIGHAAAKLANEIGGLA
jgi:hypothetical protein